MKQNATYYRALANSRYDYLEAAIETVNAYALFSISNVRRNLVRQLSYYLLHELQVQETKGCVEQNQKFLTYPHVSPSTTYLNISAISLRVAVERVGNSNFYCTLKRQRNYVASLKTPIESAFLTDLKNIKGVPRNCYINFFQSHTCSELS